MDYQTLIDVDSLQQLIARTSNGGSSLAIVDCRFDLMNPDAGRQAFHAGHIPGARYADLNLDLSSPVSVQSGRHPLPDPHTLAATLVSLGIDNNTQVVAYDEANSSFAARLWWLLRWLGHAKVAVLDGGFKAWVAPGSAVESGPSAKVGLSDRPLRFEPQIDATMVIDAAAVGAALRDPRQLLVDARAPERFAGEVEPIDAVAGHVPGAVNHPFAANLQSDGHFLPAAELRRRWQARMDGRAPGQVIAMCGSGVTACHNLLSLEAAGFKGAKLYAGSWSEWIRDPQRAIARGT